MSDKLYDERDAMALDEAGDYYSRHVFAMTAESLHSKSAIAGELGHRDMLIDLFKGQRDELASELEIQRGLNERLQSENQALSARVLARVEELQVAVQARLAAEQQRDELQTKMTAARSEAETWEKRASKEASRAKDLQAQLDDLLAALEGYMGATERMDSAMVDGLNVQGAISELIGWKDMAVAAIAKAKGGAA